MPLIPFNTPLSNPAHTALTAARIWWTDMYTRQQTGPVECCVLLDWSDIGQGIQRRRFAPLMIREGRKLVQSPRWVLNIVTAHEAQLNAAASKEEQCPTRS